VKGGRRFSFAGLVVVGNGKGKVGCGYAKANEVPPAVEKAIKDGMKNLIEVPVQAGTIPHRVEGRYETAKVILLPASPGTGIIAGAAVRAVCESAGIRDVLTKSHGSTNPVNLVKAALQGLKQWSGSAASRSRRNSHENQRRERRHPPQHQAAASRSWPGLGPWPDGRPG
jgi:small subunit ribosomal protein S5